MDLKLIAWCQTKWSSMLSGLRAMDYYSVCLYPHGTWEYRNILRNEENSGNVLPGQIRWKLKPKSEFLFEIESFCRLICEP